MSNTNKTAFKKKRAMTVAELCEMTGYYFDRGDLVERALSHSSFVQNRLDSNERLEFLGDRVVGLCAAKILYDTFPLEDEGALAVRHSNLVSAHSLARIGEDLRLDEILKVSQQEVRRNGLKNRNILADAVEALLGAIFLDGGFPPALAVSEKLFQKRLALFDRGAPIKDYKTRLQEYTQKTMGAYPSYELVSQEGPAHAPIFTVRGVIGSVSKTGKGPSKKDAEQVAAMEILSDLGAGDD
ncbi:MAG: ribonuclease III [Rickettsiales bacterium]|jgi:ribonuclease-3|nr:ribonuclease III [Rickettsiales bacterium]